MFFNEKKNLDVIIFCISITRFQAKKVREFFNHRGIKIGIVNIFWIKPFKIKKNGLAIKIKIYIMN